MGTTEIILLLLGLGVFIASFALPERKTSGKADIKLEEEKIKEIAEREMKNIQQRLDDAVGDAISVALEKTERSMERLTNEKIMAVNEYSDTVLKEINRNHEEVVFLYDMLNDKHTSVKNTVLEVEKTAKEIKQTVKDAELTVKDMEQAVRGKMEEAPEKTVDKKPASRKSPVKKKAPVKPGKPGTTETEAEPIPSGGPEVSIQFTPDDSNTNSNEKILALHKEGRSNMAIAKELGLGIGEVKLVIDLFEGL